MDQPDREAEPQFSTPYRQILLMLIVLALTAAGAFLALPRVLPVFEANPWLNGFIFFVFVLGVIATFWQVIQLIGSARWIEGFAAQVPGHELTQPPSLLAPLATMLRTMAQENRDMRMADAEKKAAALPPKLTVPMIVFFLPVLFIVILGPAYIKVMAVRGG